MFLKVLFVLYGVKILGKFNIERAGGKVWKLHDLY
jgi:hypothetical protein